MACAPLFCHSGIERRLLLKGAHYAITRSSKSQENIYDALRRPCRPSALQCVLFDRSGRICRHHGRIRLRKDDAAQHSRFTRPPHGRRTLPKRARYAPRPGGRPGAVPPQKPRICVSGLQPARHLFRAGQHPAPARTSRGRVSGNVRQADAARTKAQTFQAA